MGNAVRQPDTRRHPDLFTAAEAAAYLGADSESTIRHLRDNFGLVGYPGLGKELRYWRADLDAVALKLVGRAPGAQKMRMAK